MEHCLRVALQTNSYVQDNHEICTVKQLGIAYKNLNLLLLVLLN
jgi:hypothetical protein